MDEKPIYRNILCKEKMSEVIKFVKDNEKPGSCRSFLLFPFCSQSNLFLYIVQVSENERQMVIRKVSILSFDFFLPLKELHSHSNPKEGGNILDPEGK